MRIRKYLSNPSKVSGTTQYNSIMLIRILSENPGHTFTRNFDAKFVTTVKELLREGRDMSAQQMLRETLDMFETQKSWDEGLATSSAAVTESAAMLETSSQPLPARPSATSNAGQFQAGLVPETTGGYGFQMPLNFGDHFDFDIGPDDPDFRLVLDEMSMGFIDNMPLDLLLGDWNS